MVWTDVLILCSWSVLTVVWVVKRRYTKPTRERSDTALQRVSYSWSAFVGVCLILGGLPYAPYRIAFGPTLWGSSPVAAWLGAAFAFAGLLFAIWARLGLGTNWSARVVLKIDHELVTQGPYAVVRHPIYSGLLLMVTGTAIASGTYGSMLGLLLVTLGAWIKLRREEALMLRAFPDSYPGYQRRVKCLIPFVW